MKKLLFIICCLSFGSAFSQKTVDVSSDNVYPLSPSFFNVIAGEPIVNAKFTRLVEGTPYFSDEWMKGIVFLNDNKGYSGIYLKLDLYNNQVHYKNQNGDELTATSLIKKVTLIDSAGQYVYNFINGPYISASNKLTGWYEFIVDGKASFFKQIRKQLREDKPYGSATVEQSIFSSDHYFVLVNGNFKEVKKFKDLPDILTDKKDSISQYIKSKDLSGKKEDDYIDVINYFNSLN